MKTGINLLLWTTFVEDRHYPLLSSLKEMGYDGVELPLGRGDRAHYRALAKELNRIGLECTAISSMDVDTNPASPDAAVRQRAGERLKWAIEMADALGAGILGGPLHSAWKHFTGAPPTQDELRWSADVLREAAEYAQQAGVRMAIEILNRFESYLVNTMKDAQALVRRIGHPNLGIHYDTHHMHIEEHHAAEAIESIGDELVHVHISENDRGIPGEGQVNWADTFRALHRVGYDDWLTIESFSRSDPDFAGAIHIWRDLAKSNDEVASKGLEFMRESWGQPQD